MSSIRDQRYCLDALEQRLFLSGSSHTFAASDSNEQTYFIDAGSTFSGLGDWWTQEFTVSKNSGFVLRFASDFKADCLVATTAYESSFENNQRVASGFAVFDDQFGTQSLTLAPGRYFVGARNQVSGTNDYRLELDTKLVVANAKATGAAVPVSAKTVGADGGKLWQPFTIQSGYRYFVDGCNTGVSTYVIPADQLTNFREGISFRYYTEYSGVDKALPGLSELKLSPGQYDLAFQNDASVAKGVTYSMDAFQPSPQSLALNGGFSWKTSGSKITISLDELDNDSDTATTGSLRVRVWASSTTYAGGSLKGYVLGTLNLKPLKPHYHYSAVSQTVAYSRPKAGKYYSVLTVEEYTSAGWVIRAYQTSESRTTFK